MGAGTRGRFNRGRDVLWPGSPRSGIGPPPCEKYTAGARAAADMPAAPAHVATLPCARVGSSTGCYLQRL